MLRLVCIVEGHGEESAAPALLHRIRDKFVQEAQLVVDRPIRIRRSSFIKPEGDELKRSVELAARRALDLRSATRSAILVLLDAHEDCPKELAPRLLERARAIRSDLPIHVVLAKCEYEAWFLASIDSLREKCGLPENVPLFPYPEEISNAKEKISAQLKRGGGRRYSETVDQLEFTRCFDLAAARQQSPSFDKLCRDVIELLRLS